MCTRRATLLPTAMCCALHGKVTLFRAHEASLRSSQDSYAAWATLAAGGMDIQEIVGNHEGY